MWVYVGCTISVEEFAKAMRRQVDLAVEAAHLERFRRDFGLTLPSVPPSLLAIQNCHASETIRDEEELPAEANASDRASKKRTLSARGVAESCVFFPFPFTALSSREILVMTLEEGVSLNRLFKSHREQRSQDFDSSPLEDFFIKVLLT